MLDIKSNFFAGGAPKPAPAHPLQIAFTNDPKFRANFGAWLVANFEELTAEYKLHGRFLTLDELQDGSPLD